MTFHLGSAKEKVGEYFIEKNPLLIDLVLVSLFGFLSPKDLKSCRLVNRKWNKQSTSMFRRNSKLVFPVWKLRKKSWVEQWVKFSEAFPPLSVEEDEKEIPITAIIFRGKIFECVLTKFFQSTNGQAIRDLEFENVRVISEEDESNEEYQREEYNISDLIRDNNLTRLCVKDCDNSNTGMKDDCSTPSSVIIVEFSCLKVCEVLSLYNCSVILNEKIRPKKISIELSEFKDSEGKVFQEVLINQFVDFTNCSEVYLDKELGSTTKLDMSSLNVKLQRASLDNLEITNWENSSWTIENLALSNIYTNFTEKTRLIIKTLELVYYSNVDLAALPDTLETLTLDISLDTSNLINTNDFALPNLKCLHYVLPHKRYSELLLFKNCKHLQDLELEESFYSRSNVDKLDINYIPETVRRLSLKLVSISSPSPTREQRLKNLDTLIVSYSNLELVKFILEIMQPKILVIRHPSHGGPWTKKDFRIMLETTKMYATIQQLVMGPITVPISSIDRVVQKVLKKRADVVVEYYRSKNTLVEKLAENQFKEYFGFCNDRNGNWMQI